MIPSDYIEPPPPARPGTKLVLSIATLYIPTPRHGHIAAQMTQPSHLTHIFGRCFLDLHNVIL